MPTASARPPSVIAFDGLAEPGQSGQREQDGKRNLIRMMTVECQPPRNMRIIRPTSAAASAASRMTPNTAALTKIDWSPTACKLRLDGNSLPREEAAI